MLPHMWLPSWASTRRSQAHREVFGGGQAAALRMRHFPPWEHPAKKNPKSLLLPASGTLKAELPASPGSLFSFSLELKFLGYYKQLFPLMRTKRNIRHLNLYVAQGVKLLHYNNKWETPHQKMRKVSLGAKCRSRCSNTNQA